MPPDRPVISVIIPAHNAQVTIGAALDAVLDQDLDAPFEVIVCDDASTDGTAGVVRARAGAVRAIRSRSRGAAAARNAAIAVAAGEVLAFTDADCFPVAGWLRAGLDALREADLVQGPIVAAGERGPFDRTIHHPEASAWFPTANLFARRSLVEAAGGFRELALDADGPARRQPLGEDTLLGWRMVRTGARRGFAPTAIGRHAVFERRAREYVWYRRHWRRLPAVAHAVPELRRELFVARVFLERRTLLFDVALVATIAAVGLEGARARLLAAACVVPYARAVAVETRRWGGAAGFVGARVAADVVAFAALLIGSVQTRTVVL
jgi:glycosyltransferase involved in cell wall biosynthesis